MPVFKIPCSWEVYGYAHIEAESLEDAIEIAEDDMFPLSEVDDANYVEGSFCVDKDIAEYFAEEDAFLKEAKELLEKNMGFN